MTPVSTQIRNVISLIRPLRHALLPSVGQAIRALTMAAACAEELETQAWLSRRSGDGSHLDAMIAAFRAGTEAGGLQLDPDDLSAIVTTLELERARIIRLRNEVSRHRWNALEDDSGRVLKAASKTGNVVFLARERPFGSEGGAA